MMFLEKMDNSKVVVGVTALKMIDSPQAGLSTARSLKEAGYRIIGISDDFRIPAICLPYFDEVKIVDSLGDKNKKQFLEDLKQIAESTGMRYLIPGFDSHVLFCVELKEEIEKLGIKMLVPSLDSFKKSMKENLVALEDIVPIPKTSIAENKEEIEAKAKEVGWPMVCKGPMKDAYISENIDSTRLYGKLIRDWWGGGDGKVIMQKFIIGDYYSVTGVCDKKSNLVSFIHVKKLGIDLKGATWSGMTIFDERLNELTLKIIKRLGWVGPFEFEFVYDENENEFYLFEINPRFTAWIYLSKVAGENCPEKVIEVLQNTALPF